MEDKDINDLIETYEFQGRELRDIIEHSVILGSNKIADSIMSLVDIVETRLEYIEGAIENLQETLGKNGQGEMLRRISGNLETIADSISKK